MLVFELPELMNNSVTLSVVDIPEPAVAFHRFTRKEI